MGSEGTPVINDPSIKEAVLTVMAHRVGVHTTVLELESLMSQYTRQQIAHALQAMHTAGICRRVQRNTYVYVGVVDGQPGQPELPTVTEPVPTIDESVIPHIYESMGALDNGTIIVRSDDGRIYVLTELRKVNDE